MKKIRFFKNEKFGCVSIKQGEKEIAVVELKELKEFLSNYDRDILYLDNLG